MQVTYIFQISSSIKWGYNSIWLIGLFLGLNERIHLNCLKQVQSKVKTVCRCWLLSSSSWSISSPSHYTDQSAPRAHSTEPLLYSVYITPSVISSVLWLSTIKHLIIPKFLCLVLFFSWAPDSNMWHPSQHSHLIFNSHFKLEMPKWAPDFLPKPIAPKICAFSVNCSSIPLFRPKP